MFFLLCIIKLIFFSDVGSSTSFAQAVNVLNFEENWNKGYYTIRNLILIKTFSFLGWSRVSADMYIIYFHF